VFLDFVDRKYILRIHFQVDKRKFALGILFLGILSLRHSFLFLHHPLQFLFKICAMSSSSSSSSSSSLLNTLKVNPTSSQLSHFLSSLPQDSSIQMLNLIRYNPIALYPSDHPLHNSGISGAEAYKLYFKLTMKLFEDVGGKIVFFGEPQAGN
jgi:hypothetical protein